MVTIIGLETVKKIRKAAGLWLIAACFGLLVSSPLLSLAWGGYPCEDVNNDGACTEVDNDITADIMSGYFSTSEGIVIPEDAKGLSSQGEITLFAGKDITVNGRLKGLGITLGAGEDLTIGGDKASIKGQDFVDLSAQQNVAFGAGSDAQSQKGTVFILSWDGNVSLDGAKLSAQDSIEIVALAQGVTLSDSRLSTRGDVRIDAAGDVAVTGSRVQANGISIQAGGSLLDFSDNMVKVSGSDGWVSLSVLGSTLDLCGTHFKNLDSGNFDINASTVNCMP